MKRSAWLEIVCGLLILLFVYTAVSKLADFRAYQLRLRLQPWVGDRYRAVSLLLPAIEILTAILLIVPSLRKVGLWLAAGLMAFFSFYVGWLLSFRGDRLPCECGGIIRRLSWEGHLFLNLGFLMVALAGVWMARHPDIFVATSRRSRKPV